MPTDMGFPSNKGKSIKMGFSERERAIFANHSRQKINADEYYTYSKKGDRTMWFTIAMLIFCIVATIFQFTIMPKIMDVFDTPVAHAETKNISDHNLEKQYCAAWATNQEPVVGGTAEEIRNHCAKYL